MPRQKPVKLATEPVDPAELIADRFTTWREAADDVASAYAHWCGTSVSRRREATRSLRRRSTVRQPRRTALRKAREQA